MIQSDKWTWINLDFPLTTSQNFPKYNTTRCTNSNKMATKIHLVKHFNYHSTLCAVNLHPTTQDHQPASSSHPTTHLVVNEPLSEALIGIFRRGTANRTCHWRRTAALHRFDDEMTESLTLRRANWGPLNAVRGRLSSLALPQESGEFTDWDEAADKGDMASFAVTAHDVEPIPPPPPSPIADIDIADDPLAAVLSPGCFFGFFVRGPEGGRKNKVTLIIAASVWFQLNLQWCLNCSNAAFTLIPC